MESNQIKGSETVYQHYSRTIAAGEIAEVSVFGRFITLLSNTSSTDMQLQIDSDPLQTFPKGLSLDLPEGKFFKKIYIKNPSASSADITFAISSGKILDSRVVLSGSLSTNDTPDLFTTPAKASVTATASKIVTGSSSTRVMIIQNKGPYPCTIGDSNVDADNDRGYEIPVDGAIELKTKADIWAECRASETATLSIAYTSEST